MRCSFRLGAHRQVKRVEGVSQLNNVSEKVCPWVCQQVIYFSLLFFVLLLFKDVFLFLRPPFRSIDFYFFLSFGELVIETPVTQMCHFEQIPISLFIRGGK